MNYAVFPPEEILTATVTRLPLSKSIAARAMIFGALTGSAPAAAADRLPDCDDTRVLAAALAVKTGRVDVAECGTAARFLTAYYACTEGADVTLTGSERLCSRPIAPLVEALRALGADIVFAEHEGHLPLTIRGRHLSGGRVSLDASASSQFASALAMVAPAMEQPLTIDLGGEIASMPYLAMTMQMLRRRGVDTDREGYSIIVANTPLRPVDIESEPDWSAAAFWYEIAAVTAGWVTLPGLSTDSLQGDRVLASIGDRFGVITAPAEDTEGLELSATPDLFSRLDLDMGDYPDLVPPLAVVGCMLNIPFHFTRIGNLRIKESDRIAALQSELRKCGWILTADADSLEWDGSTVPVAEMPVLSPHGDHRLAMAFAAIAVWAPGIVITDVDVVAKSYPGFWDDLRDAGFTLQEQQ